MDKLKEIGPPTPISPANMMPMFVSSDPKPIEFSWTPMANAEGLPVAHFAQSVFFVDHRGSQGEYGRCAGFRP